MNDVAVRVDHVSKRFRVFHERNKTLKAALMRGRRASYDEFWALRDASFEIPRGSTFALVGDNGSGKSTLLKILAKILSADEGGVEAYGTVAALLEVGSGFHPELTGRENVYLNGSILGLSKSDIDERFDDIVAFSGIGEFIDQPVKNYSSGMYVRLGFSVAINVDPDILLVDEVLAVGDIRFQEKCAEKFLEFRRAGKTVVIVSHSLATVRSMCDTAVWLEKGRVREVGTALDIIDHYTDASHPDRVLDERGRVHNGSQELTVTDVALRDPAGGALLGTVRTGDAVDIAVDYSCSTPYDDAVFGLAIETVDGQLVWANNTTDNRFPIPRVDRDGRFSCRVPALRLQPGHYTVTVRICDTTHAHTVDQVQSVTSFDVLAGERPRESGGVVALDADWVTSDVPVSGP